MISDPLKDESRGWLGEDEAITSWPMLSYGNIFNFLTFFPSDLGSSEGLNDYKTSKAYSYFKKGWLGRISYNQIAETSKYCILRADCGASERINDPFHKVWVCIEKKDACKIIVAHCTCMAGMSETCNHVAALLFRVEAAVCCGLTNPSCTTK